MTNDRYALAGTKTNLLWQCWTTGINDKNTFISAVAMATLLVLLKTAKQLIQMAKLTTYKIQVEEISLWSASLILTGQKNPLKF